MSQHSTPQALDFDSKYQMAVWWATPVEIASALARLRRRQEISEACHAQAQRQAQGLANLWRVVAPSAEVARGACALVELYALRAADALQLSAALQWCEGEPEGNVFLTFDQRLGEAAGRVGFALE